ncbi:hypothetical protein EMCRGX_G013563 [Ephydatia muelleri]
MSQRKRTRYREYARDPTIPVPSRTILRQGLAQTSSSQGAQGQDERGCSVDGSEEVVDSNEMREIYDQENSDIDGDNHCITKESGDNGDDDDDDDDDGTNEHGDDDDDGTNEHGDDVDNHLDDDHDGGVYPDDNDDGKTEDDVGGTIPQPLTAAVLKKKLSLLPLYSDAPLSTKASWIACNYFSVTNNLSEAATKQLLDLIAIHCPKRDQCARSTYQLRKRLNPFDDVEMH